MMEACGDVNCSLNMWIEVMVACEQVDEGTSKRRYLEEDFMDPNQLLCLGALFNIAATNVSMPSYAVHEVVVVFRASKALHAI